MAEHHSTLRARRLAVDAKKQQSRRDTMKQRSAPDTHAINRALAGAVVALFRDALRSGTTDKREMNFQISDVIKEATRILCSGETAISRYNPEEVYRTLGKRLTGQ